MRTGDAERLLVHADSFRILGAISFQWLPPLGFVLGIFLRCLFVDRSALLQIVTDNNIPYRCTRGPAEDNRRVLDELHVEVSVPLVHADFSPAQVSSIPFVVQMA